MEAKVQKHEKKYKLEEIEKQKKEQGEKERFLRALNELKILSSKEYIAQLKQKAETHPIWKHNAPYLPFSWHELPDFVNADIPNGDWIFGCDRRIWQTAFYKSFIWKGNDKRFCIENVDNWLQNKVGCKVSRSVTILGIDGKHYRELVPADIYANLPSSWKTLRAYFNYLRDLGMLEFSGDDYRNPGNDWFRAIGKKPKPDSRTKAKSQMNKPIENKFFDQFLLLFPT